MILETEAGKKYETKCVPPEYDPVFCAKCGCRLAWVDIGISGDQIFVVCEDCIAGMQEHLTAS